MTDRSRKIAFVGNFGFWHRGTLGYRTLPMARELMALGHRVVVIAPPWDSPGEPIGKGIEWDVTVRRIETPRARPGLRGHALIAARLARALVAERPDVIVAVKPIAYAGLIAPLLGWLPKPRIVVDTDDWEGRGGWSDLASLAPLERALIRLQEQIALRSAHHVIVASHELDRLVGTLGVPANRRSYVANATWPGLATWRALGTEIAPDVDLVVYSRLFEFDHARFVSLLSRLVAARPSLSVRVLGASIGDESTALRARLVEAGLRERVEFVGWVERESIAVSLRRGRVALALLDDTRVNRARCSVKMLDLMLAECTIIAEGVGEVRHFLADGATALLATPGDGAALAKAVLTLLDDAPLARALAIAAGRVARERFTWESQRDILARAILGAD
ncbi:MAG: glycosyltransferase [Chloroflexota bacterium]|nr:MAG: glycosyltransferase [Chloroflexota bacterium]